MRSIQWLAYDTRRFARVRWPDGSVPVGGPKKHPFKPVLALRLSLKEVSGDDQEKVVTALWKGAWGALGDHLDLMKKLTASWQLVLILLFCDTLNHHPLFPCLAGSKFEYDIADPTDLHSLLTKHAGLSTTRASELISLAQSDSAKSQLMKTTRDALDRYKIWGVPVIVVDSQDVYWGNDQIPYVELQLDGKGVLIQSEMTEEEREELETWERLQRGIDRKGMDPRVRLAGKI